MKPLLFVYLLAIVFLSCRKDPSWETELSGPLLNADMGIEDFIPDSLLTTNADSLLVLVLDQQLYTVKADSLVDMPDSLLSYRYTVPFTANIPPNSLILSKTEKKFYRMGGVTITDLKIRSGKMEVRALNYCHGNAFIKYSLDNSALNGGPMSIEGYLPNVESNGDSPITASIDISGAEINLRQGWQQSNTLISTFKVYSDPSSTTNVPVVSGDSIIILVQFRDIIVDYARGSFGTQDIISDGTTDFAEFDNLGLSMLDLNEVKGAIIITNNLGSDVQFLISKVEGIGNHSVELNHPDIGKSISLVRATEISPGNGVANAASHIFNLEEGNIVSFIENIPKKIKFSIEGTINSLGNISAGNDFYYFGKSLDAHLHLEIPMNLAFTNLILRDTFSIDWSQNNPSYIKEASLQLNISNDFPLEAFLKIYFLNSSELITDSISGDRNIQAALVNGSGATTNSTNTQMYLTLNQSQIQHLHEAKSAIINVVFNTGGSSGQKVKFYPHYRLKIRMSGDFIYFIQS